ncbi:MAG: ABC transporter permease [Betaproteobacteria bacterium RIFCSPLOWO2_02_FULL_66_14]|nr:MAG: ABC transporter permease [Betaproteobacteria bacterium RIFCSPLOWO2_02_FULL_66_14]
MINLAIRDVRQSLGRYLLTGVGLGLLIGVTLTMAGVYRGMADDAQTLLRSAGADIWVVQQHTLGPFAEPSSIHDDAWRSIRGLPGVAETGNVTFLTMQVAKGAQDVRAMVAGYEPGRPGEPAFLIAGRPVTRSHYEAIADAQSGFAVGDRIRIRRHEYTVVGLTRRMVTSGGDPMIFIPLKDAQEAQFLKDNDAVREERNRLAQNPAINRPGVPGLLEAVGELQTANRYVNAVLVRVAPGWDAGEVAAEIRRWRRLQAFTSAEMEQVLVGTVIERAAKQIGLFLVILTIVSIAIVAFIIYSMTAGKLREIAVLKLIGTRNRTIAAMILQEALGLGVIGFFVGRHAAQLWAPVFPRHILLLPEDALRALVLALTACTLASLIGIRLALRVDPAEAIGG